MEESFEILAEWKVIHEYYRKGICRCIEMVPDRKTKVLLGRRGVKFKKNAVNEWVILGKKDVVWDEEDKVVLDVRIKDPYFGYYTETGLPAVIGWNPGEKREDSFVYTCLVKRLKWEYIFLMRKWRGDCRLELREAEGKLNFRQEETVTVAGYKGIRIVSVKPVELRETYDYRLRLYEQKPLGSKVLLQYLPFPLPGKFPECGEGCIREIVLID